MGRGLLTIWEHKEGIHELGPLGLGNRKEDKSTTDTENSLDAA